MTQYYESERYIPILAETDVLVVGSGPSGVAAALASSRAGAKTMLVERYGFFGGVITQSMIGSFSWYRINDKVVDVGGIGRELEERAVEMGATYRENMKKACENTKLIETSAGKKFIDKTINPNWERLDTELYKYVIDTMIKESNITPLLHCLVADVIMEGNEIKGVITESKSGRQAIFAKRVIDASGDGDIAFHAGVPFYKIPKGEMEGVTVNFGCRDVDIEKYLTYRSENPTSISDWNYKSGEKEKTIETDFMVKPFIQAKEAGEFPKNLHIECYPGSFTEFKEILTMDPLFMRYCDATDVWELTNAELEGRERALQIIKIFNKYVPGFENAKLRNFGHSLGIRETRIFDCMYNMTEHDVLNEARFDDSIGIFPEFLDGYDYAIMPTTGRYMHLPYRMILPKGIENLYITGRCVGGDKNSHAALRQMMCCITTGQGAGVAAAVSLKDNVATGDVDISKVQDILEKLNARVK